MALEMDIGVKEVKSWNDIGGGAGEWAKKERKENRKIEGIEDKERREKNISK